LAYLLSEFLVLLDLLLGVPEPLIDLLFFHSGLLGKVLKQATLRFFAIETFIRTP